MVIFIVHINQNKVLFHNILVIRLQAYLVSILLIPLHPLLISLTSLSVTICIMVNLGSILETMLGIVLNLADHVIMVAAKYANRRVILHPIAIIVIFVLIQTMTIYLLLLLVFMSLTLHHQQSLLLIVYRLSGLEIQEPRIIWHLMLT